MKTEVKSQRPRDGGLSLWEEWEVGPMQISLLHTPSLHWAGLLLLLCKACCQWPARRTFADISMSCLKAKS